MANLKEKIQDLLKNTTSAEVKSVCESFLKETDGKDIKPTDMIAESLFTNLKNYVNIDSKVGTLLNEREGYSKSIMDIESQISKEAAQRLAESWDTVRRDKKVSNVGNHIQNSLLNEKKEEKAKNDAILEKLAGLDDATAKKFVEKAKIDSYCVKESIDAIKGSQIANHPNLKYVLAKFEAAIMENTAEHLLVSDFLSQITPFKWDPTIKAATEKVQESINSKAADLEVQNTIYAIKSTDNKRFFTDITNRMNEWLYSDNKSVHGLIKEMKSYLFNPHVKELTNRLLLMENSKGTTFNIPVKDANCSIVKIVSPVHVDTATNGQVFKAGSNFYHAAEGKFKKLTEAQINALPKAYIELCESFFNPAVKVNENDVVVYLGNTKVRFDAEKRIFVNEKQIDPSTLGSQLMFHTQQTIFRNTSNMANVAMNIYENLDNICEIDYGKAILSNVFEGVGAYLFKTNGKIYINKVNPSMNENSFVSANALQTVKLIKEFLSFNMSESLSEFLEGNYKTKAIMEGEMNTVLSNIQVLESELDKIEKAILEDPSFADVKEIADAKTLIENELNRLKSEWQAKSDELNKFETIAENDEEEEEEVKDEEPTEPEAEDDAEKANDEPAADDAAPADDADAAKADDELAADDAAIVAATENPVGDDAAPAGDDAPPAPTEDPLASDTPPPADDAAPVVAEPVVAEPVAPTLVDNGLLGAGGTQAAATGIPGNDHLDANANGAVNTDPTQLKDVGFAGAAAQPNADAAATSTAIEEKPADQPVVTPGHEPEVIPADTPQTVQTAASNEPAEDGAVVVAADDKDGEAVVVDVDIKKDETNATEESVKENKNTLAESIGVDSKVKDKVTGQGGTVTATNDEKFTILLDDGQSVERTLAELEDVAVEIEANIANNEKPVDGEAPAENIGDPVGAQEGLVKNENEEVPNATGVEGGDAEQQPEPMFVHATLTIDIGPFKAGDAVEIEASSYTSSGEDDPIKLKEPKDGVTEVPKKYLAVADKAPEEGANDVDAKVAAVLQQIADLETFLNDENTKGSKAIEDAKEKIKKFAKSLEPKEPEAEEKPADAPKDEVK